MKCIDDYVDESGLLITSKAIDEGITKTQLYSFIKENHYEKVKHGVYISPDSWVDDNYVICLRCSRIIFSHDEALYYHGLIDREPLNKTVTTYTGYGTSRLLKDDIKVYTVKKELLEIGKIMVTNSFGHVIPIYDLERTICDLIRNRSQFEIQDFQTALKTYLSKKDKDLNKLMSYAKLFHIDSILRTYMEVML